MGPGTQPTAVGATHCAGSQPGPRRCSTAKDQPHACQQPGRPPAPPRPPTALRLATRCCLSSLGRCPHNPCLTRSTGVLPTPQAPAVATGVRCLKPTDTGHGQCSLPRPRHTARPAGTHLHDQVDRIGHFLWDREERERKGSVSSPTLAAPGGLASGVWPGHWAPWTHHLGPRQEPPVSAGTSCQGPACQA